MKPGNDVLPGFLLSVGHVCTLVASQGASGYPLHPTRGTTPIEWQFTSPSHVDRAYDWFGPDGVFPYNVSQASVTMGSGR